MKRILFFVLALNLFSVSLFSQYNYSLQNPIVKENFRLGVIAYNSAKFGEAILLFEKTLSDAPRDPLVLYWLGKAYMQSGLSQTALNRWRDSLLAGSSIFVQSKIELFENLFIQPLERNYTVALSIPGKQKQQMFFMRPSFILPLENGNFILISHGTNQLVLVNVNGVIIQQIQGNPGGFDRPFACIRDSAGFIYVSEFQANRIAKMTENGSIVSYIGQDKVIGPQFLALDSDESLYVSEAGTGRISKFDNTGAYVFSFNGKGGSFPGLKLPTGIAIQGSNIFVADAIHKSIVVFDLYGNFIGEYAKGLLTKPESLAWNQGKLIISDGARILELSPESDSIVELFKENSARFTSAMFDANGDLAITDFDNSRMLLVSDTSARYSGLVLETERIYTDAFPKITVDIRVRDRYGNPVTGLGISNFYIAESVTKLERIVQNGIPLDKKTDIIKPVSNISFEGSLDTSSGNNLVILLEASPFIASQKTKVRDFIAALMNQLPSSTQVSLVFAGKNAHPAVQGSIQEISKAILSMPAESDWRFDTGVKLAVNELVKTSRSRGILFITSGTIRDASFVNAAPRELLLLLSNNRISMHTLCLSSTPDLTAIRYLSSNSGGTLYYADDPRGSSPLAKLLTKNTMGVYRLSFTSTADPMFGQNYLPISIEVYLRNKSGKDETGYFAPLQ